LKLQHWLQYCMWYGLKQTSGSLPDVYWASRFPPNQYTEQEP
jgi:hypothetical protein